jgi:enoyl-CoA hydratase
VSGPGLRVDRREDVWWVQIDDPPTRNALTTPLLVELAAVLADADDGEVSCVVVRGGSKVFASGADLRALAEAPAAELYMGPRAGAWDRIFAAKVPRVAMVEGLALGGGFELVLACDIVVAAESARFGLPESSLALVPGAGGTQRLARAAGKALTMDVVLAGRILSAEEAAAHGVVSRVVGAAELEEVVSEVVSAVAGRSRLATRLAKAAVLASAEHGLADGLALERQSFLLALESGEAREAIRAFLDRSARQGPRRA